jgi:hypothetical protein
MGSVSAPVPRSTGRMYLLLGVLLGVLGLVIYFVQIGMQQFVVPWYAPILATAGAALILLATVKRPGVIRVLVLLVFLALAGFEWYVLTVATRLPAYAGPVKVGQPLPAFATTRADGSPFTDKDLQAGNPAVLVFFRGHW